MSAKWELLSAGLLASCLLLSAPLWAQGRDVAQNVSLADALSKGDPGLMLRYRYEFVDQDSFADNANASTVLLRLNYKTGAWNGWKGVVEFDEVLEVLVNDFNSGAGTSSPRRDRYPVVADPNGADLNELYLEHAPDKSWAARLGRQLINLDDQRYVGGVGWRQNEQTYDGGSLLYEGFRDTSIFYTYVANVNRIFGERVDAGDHKHDTHLLNARVTLDKDWSVVGYAYLIDTDDAPTFSTDTFGLRANGAVTLGGEVLNLLGEFATQSDAGSAPASFDANYFRLQAIWTGDLLSAGIGMESLGSDNGQGFRTPLATLHAFNGWADQFLTTPAAGLDDVYVRLGLNYSKWQVLLTYHDFSPETGGGDFGDELDISASRKFGERYGLLLKFASYSAEDAPLVDTLKAWVMFTANY